MGGWKRHLVPARTRLELETTASLLARSQAGDASAREQLLARYLPILLRWAHGRLPRRARDLHETDDLVQVSLIRALEHLDGFVPRREGAFLAFLRRIFLNQVRDQIRRANTKPRREALHPDLPGRSPSPLEEAMGKQTLERYDRALARLPERQQEAVFLRLELGFTHDEVAKAIGARTGNAARMLVSRALVELAKEMERP